MRTIIVTLYTLVKLVSLFAAKCIYPDPCTNIGQPCTFCTGCPECDGVEFWVPSTQLCCDESKFVVCDPFNNWFVDVCPEGSQCVGIIQPNGQSTCQFD